MPAPLYPLASELLTPGVKYHLELVMRDGASKHPDIETGAPVDEHHEFHKAALHVARAQAGEKFDPDSGADPVAHAAMRLLKVLRSRVPHDDPRCPPLP